MFLIYFAIIIVMIASMWKIFTKAGKPGWAAIIPIYNIIVLLEIVGRPMWWILIYLVCAPIAAIIISLDLAKSFGKEIGFGIGLIILPIVFMPMLGFGSATYVGPSAAQNKPQA
ncbi:MAG: signal peptidase I [Ignavibacteriae bacterium]|nr:signal peptidase I [Ignavibacteriota bacterium]